MITETNTGRVSQIDLNQCSYSIDDFRYENIGELQRIIGLEMNIPVHEICFNQFDAFKKNRKTYIDFMNSSVQNVFGNT